MADSSLADAAFQYLEARKKGTPKEQAFKQLIINRYPTTAELYSQDPQVRMAALAKTEGLQDPLMQAAANYVPYTGAGGTIAAIQAGERIKNQLTSGAGGLDAGLGFLNDVAAIGGLGSNVFKGLRGAKLPEMLGFK